MADLPKHGDRFVRLRDGVTCVIVAVKGYSRHASQKTVVLRSTSKAWFTACSLKDLETKWRPA